MKNNHIIILALLLWISLPSCMVSKCRYSNGFKIDLSIGNGKEAKADVREIKAAKAEKKVKSNVAEETVLTDTTAIVAVASSDTSIKVQQVVSANKTVTTTTDKQVRKQQRKTTAIVGTKNIVNDKAQQQHSSATSVATKTQSDDYLDFLGAVAVLLILGIALIAAGIVGAITLLGLQAFFEALGMIIPIILALCGYAVFGF